MAKCTSAGFKLFGTSWMDVSVWADLVSDLM